ncbi:olfactory receptor 5V1-like [Discoglossus pictus]
MYFFLGNLACLDICCSSVTAPRLLFDLHDQKRMISRLDCITQVYFFTFLATSEIFLLAVMSCDRYIAICPPLHYMQIMHWKVCVQLASGVWAFGVVSSLVHTLCTLRLAFCGSNTIHNFLCDLPQLLQLSCTDIFMNIVVKFLLGGLTVIVCLVMTIVPYISIFSTVLKIQVQNTRHKAFSTCASHLTVVFIFYSAITFNYFRPNPTYHFTEDRLASIFYAIITSFLNPLIYSLRNKELREALSRAL